MERKKIKTILLLVCVFFITLCIKEVYDYGNCRWWYTTANLPQTDKSGFEWEYDTCEKIKEVTKAHSVVFAVVDGVFYIDICGEEEILEKYKKKIVKQIKRNKYDTTVIRMYEYGKSLNDAFYTDVLEK